MSLIVLIAMEFELNEVRIDMKWIGKGLYEIIKKDIIPNHEWRHSAKSWFDEENELVSMVWIDARMWCY